MRLPNLSGGISGLALTEIVVLLGFLAIIASAIVFTVDPGQKAGQQRDKNLQADAQVLIAGFYGFYAERGVMPWALGVSQQPAPALPWKSANSPEVGLCTDVGCTKAGPLALSAKVPADFYQRAWVRSPADYIYVGKGQGSGPVFACFIPVSRSLRKKTGQLYKIDIGKDVPGNLLGFGCPATTTWSEEDVCYMCVAK